jgi:hypothetical protein
MPWRDSAISGLLHTRTLRVWGVGTLRQSPEALFVRRLSISLQKTHTKYATLISR